MLNTVLMYINPLYLYFWFGVGFVMGWLAHETHDHIAKLEDSRNAR